MTWKKKKEEEDELLTALIWAFSEAVLTGESGSWDTVCCLTANLYSNQLILHIHACITLLFPLTTPVTLKTTLYKKTIFSVFLLETKLYM